MTLLKEGLLNRKERKERKERKDLAISVDLGMLDDTVFPWRPLRLGGESVSAVESYLTLLKQGLLNRKDVKNAKTWQYR